MKKSYKITLTAFMILFVFGCAYYSYTKFKKETALLPITAVEKPILKADSNPKPSTMGQKVNAPVKLPKKVQYVSAAYVGDDSDLFPFKNANWQKNLEKFSAKNDEFYYYSISDGFISYGYENHGKVVAFNIDVRTGEEFSLRDVFADNVDAEYELNKYLSLYLLSINEEKAKDFAGLDMNTKFYVDAPYGRLVLFPDNETPLLANQEIIIPFKVLGNDGDCIAIYDRFPKFNNNELDISKIKQAKIANSDTMIANITKEIKTLEAKYQKAKEAFLKKYPEDEPVVEHWDWDRKAFSEEEQERLEYLRQEYYWEKDTSKEAKNLTIKDYVDEWNIEYDKPKTKEQIKKLEGC